MNCYPFLIILFLFVYIASWLKQHIQGRYLQGNVTSMTLIYALLWHRWGAGVSWECHLFIRCYSGIPSFQEPYVDYNKLHLWHWPTFPRCWWNGHSMGPGRHHTCMHNIKRPLLEVWLSGSGTGSLPVCSQVKLHRRPEGYEFESLWCLEIFPNTWMIAYVNVESTMSSMLWISLEYLSRLTWWWTGKLWIQKYSMFTLLLLCLYLFVFEPMEIYMDTGINSITTCPFW